MEARFEARFDHLEEKLDRVVDADVRIRERLARLEAENDRAWGGLDEFAFIGPAGLEPATNGL